MRHTALSTVLVLTLIVASLLFGTATTIKASSISAVVATSLETQTASFGIFFLTPPDFVTADEFGRLATSFQFYVDPDQEVSYPGDLLVRKAEGSPLGEATVVETTPHGYPGGWGPLLGTVPLLQEGIFVRVDVPLAWLGAADGTFFWALDTFEYGWSDTDRRLTGEAVPGPAPTALPDTGPPLLLLAAVLMGIHWMALKAQSNSRATAEALAAIQNPPTVFARQANIANGPQQINNADSP